MAVRCALLQSGSITRDGVTIMLPVDTVIRGATLKPRVWLVNTTAGVPQIPQTLTLDDAGTPRVVKVWDTFESLSVGGFPARELRTNENDRLCVLVRASAITLPDTRTGAIVIAWHTVPSKAATLSPLWQAFETALAANVVKAWACDLDADGAWLVSAMDAAGGAAGALAQANWPVLWRKRLVTDFNGDLVTPAAPPTGPRCIGAVLAS